MFKIRVVFRGPWGKLKNVIVALAALLMLKFCDIDTAKRVLDIYRGL